MITTDSLNGMLKAMTQQQQSVAMDMFKFYSAQYDVMASNHDDLSVVHNLNLGISELVEEAIKMSVDKKPTCHNGCSHCCYQRVDITEQEAKILLMASKEVLHNVNFDILKKQLVDDTTEYMNLGKDVRRCVFLNSSENCSVYEYRPAACRKLISVSEKEKCDTEVNKNEMVERLVNLETEIISSVVLNKVKSGGMAEMILSVIGA